MNDDNATLESFVFQLYQNIGFESWMGMLVFTQTCITCLLAIIAGQLLFGRGRKKESIKKTVDSAPLSLDEIIQQLQTAKEEGKIANGNDENLIRKAYLVTENLPEDEIRKLHSRL